MLLIAALLLLFFMALGVPVAFAIGLSGLAAISFTSDIPLLMVVQQMVRGINSFPLMACPLFILAGEIMGAAKLSERIVEFSSTLVSWVKGGVGIIAVVANMIFAAITGSGAASISAIGSLMVPELKKAGYKPGFTAALIAGGGSLGPIIPPSLNMVIFGSITGASVGKLFLGGMIPGLIIGGFMMILCFIYSTKHKIDEGTGTFSITETWKSFKYSIFALITPVIIIGGVISGVFTATEAGITASVYGLICGLFIYKTITLKDLVPIFRKATESSAMIMMIMGIATIYSYIFSVENIAIVVRDFMLSISTDPTIIMLMILGVMVIVGMFMETLAAMAVLLPVVFPVIMELGIDPIQFGVMFVISTVLGGLTPPVGVYLFLSMDIAKASFTETAGPIALMALCVLLTAVLIIFIPQIATFIPGLM